MSDFETAAALLKAWFVELRINYSNARARDEIVDFLAIFEAHLLSDIPDDLMPTVIWALRKRLARD